MGAFDIPPAAVKYFDQLPFDKDIPFFRNRLRGTKSDVLELGCGTGRVMLELLQLNACRFVHGIDRSEPMLEACRRKIAALGFSSNHAMVDQADITGFELHRTFDVMIAPGHVLQNLETRRSVDGMMMSVRRHLAPKGRGFLTAFMPQLKPKPLRKLWESQYFETFCWEKKLKAGRITCHQILGVVHPARLIAYPKLVFRWYDGDALREEVTIQQVMRAYYPDELEQLVLDHGFVIRERYGGYAGEPWGQGPELILEFEAP